MFKKIGKAIVAIALVFSATLGVVACGKGDDNKKDYNEISQSARVMELGNNVDKVPKASETADTSKSDKTTTKSLKSRSNHLNINSLDSDASSIEDAIEMEIYPSGEAEVSSFSVTIGNEFTAYDSTKSLATELKREFFTILNLKQYNVWIDRLRVSEDNTDVPEGFSSKVRASYDINLDALTMEEINTSPNGDELQISYSKIISSYDIDGNMVVDFYSVAYKSDGVLRGSYSFHYNENVIYRIANVAYNTGENPFGDNKVVTNEYNLVEFVLEEGKEQSSILKYKSSTGTITGIYQTVNYGTLTTVKQRDGYNILYEMEVGSQKTKASGEYDYGQEDVRDTFDARRYNVNVFDGSGKECFRYSALHFEDYVDVEITDVPLFLLTGYDKVYQQVDNLDICYMMIGGEKVDTYSMSNIEKDITSSVNRLSGGLYYNEATSDYEWRFYPVIYVGGKKHSYDDDFDMYNFLSDFYSKIGLSFISDSSSMINGMQDYCEYLSNWEMFGLNNFDTLGFDEFFSKFNEYRGDIMSFQDVQSLNQETYILPSQQVENGSIYKSITIDDTISVTIDTTTGSIDLSNINITVPKKQLFVEGNEYRLVAKLVSATHSIDLASKSVVFNNDSMTFNGFESVVPDFTAIEKHNKYTLAIYLACYTIEGYQRVTDDIKINYANFDDFSMQKTINEESCKVCYSNQNKLVIELVGSEE